MHVSKKLVRDFQEVYERTLGERISAKEAEQMLLDLAELIKLFEIGRNTNYGY